MRTISNIELIAGIAWLGNTPNNTLAGLIKRVFKQELNRRQL